MIIISNHWICYVNEETDLLDFWGTLLKKLWDYSLQVSNHVKRKLLTQSCADAFHMIG